MKRGPKPFSDRRAPVLRRPTDADRDERRRFREERSGTPAEGPARPRSFERRFPGSGGRAAWPPRSGAGERTERDRGPRPGAVRYRVDLEYVGTRYSGWQFQTNARTVAGELMEAVHRATGERVLELYGSGRTDAGVHAIHQVAHLDLGRDVDPKDLRERINAELPPDINILEIATAPPGFHARFSAGGRTYLYRISRRRTAFDKPFVWWVQDPLDVSAMARAAGTLRGFHDFASFARRDPSRPAESTTVKVEGVEVFEQGDSIFIRITGSHFLWKMVRRVVGVLVEVGRGRLADRDVLRLLTTESGEAAPFTAPPSGLSLERVSYDAPRPIASFRDGAVGGARRGRGREGAAAGVLRRSASGPSEGPREGGTRASGDRRASRWPPRSASPESPRGRDTRTFRRRG